MAPGAPTRIRFPRWAADGRLAMPLSVATASALSYPAGSFACAMSRTENRAGWGCVPWHSLGTLGIVVLQLLDGAPAKSAG